MRQSDAYGSVSRNVGSQSSASFGKRYIFVVNMTYESLNASFGSTSQGSSMDVSSLRDLMSLAWALVCLCSPFTRRTTASGT